MIIAIADANIFIDTIHIGLLGHLFSLDQKVHTSQEVLNEMNNSELETLQSFVKQGKLTIDNCDQVPQIESIRKMKELSNSDKSVMYLATHKNAIILAGEELLRKAAEIQKIELHDIFWLFDQFIEKKLITKRQAGKDLKKLMLFKKQLPIDECNKRLTTWK